MVNSIEQIAVVTATITTHCAQLQDLSSAFVTQQEALKISTVKHAEDLKADLQAQLEAYSSQAKVHSSEASALLKSKADAMENVSILVCSYSHG